MPRRAPSTTHDYRFETGKAGLYWAGNASVFVAARAACSLTPVRNRLLRALLWFGSLASLLAVLQYYTSEGKVFWLFPSGYEHVLGPFLYKNECAAFIELVFPLAVYQSLVDDRDSLLYIGMTATMFAAVVTAVSRAGAVLVVCELLLVLLLAWRGGLIPAARLRRRAVWTAVFSLTLAAVVGWQVTLEKFREREPYRVRRELLLSSLAMITDRPVMGFGLGTWPAVYPAYARFDNGLAANHAHNDWAEWAAEGGVPFVALMALVALWSVRSAANSLWGVGVPVTVRAQLLCGTGRLQGPICAACITRNHMCANGLSVIFPSFWPIPAAQQAMATRTPICCKNRDENPTVRGRYRSGVGRERGSCPAAFARARSFGAPRGVGHFAAATPRVGSRLEGCGTPRRPGLHAVSLPCRSCGRSPGACSPRGRGGAFR